MAYRFKTRSTTPGQYRLAPGTLAQLISTANILTGVGRGDGGVGTLDISGGGTPPTTGTLTITDNADGTGGVATVASCDATASIVLHIGKFGGDFSEVVWTYTVNRTGNGNLTMAIPVGFYWAEVITTLAGISASFGLQYFVITDGEDAIHYRAMYAVQSRIQTMALSGVANGSIVVKKLPLQRIVKEPGVAMPAILITPARGSMNPTAGTNALDDPTYAVMVTLLEADNQEATLEANLERHTKWHEQIERAFQNQRLPGVTEIYNCAVDPQEPVIPQAWAQNLYASAVLLKFTARVPRGLNA